jgi:hypothetical protein
MTTSPRRYHNKRHSKHVSFEDCGRCARDREACEYRPTFTDKEAAMVSMRMFNAENSYEMLIFVCRWCGWWHRRVNRVHNAPPSPRVVPPRDTVLQSTP